MQQTTGLLTYSATVSFNQSSPPKTVTITDSILNDPKQISELLTQFPDVQVLDFRKVTQMSTEVVSVVNKWQPKHLNVVIKGLQSTRKTSGHSLRNSPPRSYSPSIVKYLYWGYK